MKYSKFAVVPYVGLFKYKGGGTGGGHQLNHSCLKDKTLHKSQGHLHVFI